MTFINPTLKMVSNVYKKYIEHKKDPLIINKSSIVFLLEYKNITLLFTGDCYLSDITNKINDIQDLDNIDFIKLPHHGAKDNNVGIKEILEKYKCKKIGITYGENDKNHPNKIVLDNIKDLDLEIYANCDKKVSKQNFKNMGKVIEFSN